LLTPRALLTPRVCLQALQAAMCTEERESVSSICTVCCALALTPHLQLWTTYTELGDVCRGLEDELKFVADAVAADRLQDLAVADRIVDLNDSDYESDIDISYWGAPTCGQDDFTRRVRRVRVELARNATPAPEPEPVPAPEPEPVPAPEPEPAPEPAPEPELVQIKVEQQ